MINAAPGKFIQKTVALFQTCYLPTNIRGLSIMSLKVIGAGFGRTGTNSFKIAMEMLGFGKCHHMTEVLANLHQAPAFLAAAQGRSVDWDEVYKGYQSCCDWPSCHFWRELADAFPEAKVVLTVRDSESWFRSMSKTILLQMSEADAMLEQVGPTGAPVFEMSNEIIFRQTFEENIEDKQKVIAAYERHNQAVRDNVPAARLLEFQARDGWKPLCDFLEVPIPAEPYPSTNDPDGFRKIVDDFKHDMSEGG